MYLYQVIAPDGRVMVQCTDSRCTYPADLERDIKRAGFKIRVQQDQPGREDGSR